MSRVHWGFLAAELRAMPQAPDAAQAAIDPVIQGMDLLFSGQQWPDARAAAADAYAATDAAAAYTTDAAADAAATAAKAAAAYAAAKAANAANAAANAAKAAAYAAKDTGRARLRQRDTLLALIAAA